MRNSHNLDKSFKELLFDLRYRYKGVAAWKLPGDRVEIQGRQMSIEEFHEYVDNAYDSIEKSLNTQS